MAKVEIKGVKRLLKKFEKIRKEPKLSVATRVGREVVKGIKEFTKNAKSPITGRPYGELSDKYADFKARGGKPKTKRRKKKRKNQLKIRNREPKPNLRLTGEFMKGLEFDTKGSQSKGYITIVGYNEDQAPKEEGHREQNPSRPTIPEGKEKFAKEIQDKIVQIYEAAIARIIRGRSGN